MDGKRKKRLPVLFGQTVLNIFVLKLENRKLKEKKNLPTLLSLPSSTTQGERDLNFSD
jgi:hypothetical protein